MEPDGSLPLVSVMLGYRWMKMKRPGRKLSTQVAAPVAAQAPAKTRKNGPQMLATFSQTFFFLPFTAMQPIVPLLVADNFELSAELWGAVCAAEGAAKIICAMPVATCLISNGRKPVLVAAFLCFGFAMYALAHTNTILGLLGGKLLVGAAVLAQNSGMQLYLTDISTVENKSRVMAPVLMAEKLSSVLGPLIGGKLIHLFGAKMAMSHLAVITWLGTTSFIDVNVWLSRNPHICLVTKEIIIGESEVSNPLFSWFSLKTLVCLVRAFVDTPTKAAAPSTSRLGFLQVSSGFAESRDAEGDQTGSFSNNHRSEKQAKGRQVLASLERYASERSSSIFRFLLGHYGEYTILFGSIDAHSILWLWCVGFLYCLGCNKPLVLLLRKACGRMVRSMGSKIRFSTRNGISWNCNSTASMGI